MAPPRRAAERVRLVVDPLTWREEVERFDQRSEARAVGERSGRAMLERGVSRAEVRRCGDGHDGTALAGRLKVYVPLDRDAVSERPYGFVLSPARDAGGELVLRVIAFGERHPSRSGVRSVYERAHRRLYGRYPGQ